MKKSELAEQTQTVFKDGKEICAWCGTNDDRDHLNCDEKALFKGEDTGTIKGGIQVITPNPPPDPEGGSWGTAVPQNTPPNLTSFVASEASLGSAGPEEGSLPTKECTCPPEIREKEKHYSECPQYVEPELPPLTGLPPEVLLKALYWVHDFMDRALINFYVVGQTGADIKAQRDLSGNTVQVAVRELEWISGARNIADAFATPLVDRGTVVEYEYDGVRVILYVLEDSETLTNFDTQIYRAEYFKLPNPYEQFQEEFAWLK